VALGGGGGVAALIMPAAGGSAPPAAGGSAPPAAGGSAPPAPPTGPLACCDEHALTTARTMTATPAVRRTDMQTPWWSP